MRSARNGYLASIAGESLRAHSTTLVAAMKFRAHSVVKGGETNPAGK